MSNITLSSTSRTIAVSADGQTVTIQQTGQPGPGVAPGGTTGQVLAKASNTDYDTEWVDQTGGGGSSTFVGLTDTPGAFIASRIVSVNAAGDALEFPTAADARTLLGLGTAALDDTGDFATAAQGALADSAVQPGDLASVATTGAYSDLSGLPSLFDGAYSSLSGIPSTFQPSSHSLGSHNDVTISLITSGDFLRWNGSAWVNTALGTSDIPNLAASKITSGTFDDARIPSLAASKITSGTLADAQISESSVTQHEAALDILGSQVSGKAGPGASFDGGGAAIADDVIVRSPVTEAGTVSTVYAVADQSGSVSVIVRHYAAADTSFASPTSLGTLSISTAQVGTLGSLSQAVAVGDVLEFEIDGAATNIERLAVRARI